MSWIEFPRIVFEMFPVSPEISIPCPVLNAIVLPNPDVTRPIVDVRTPPALESDTPLPPFGTAPVPVTSVPMRFPSTRVFETPGVAANVLRRIPLKEFPEMRFPSPAKPPPMMLSDEPIVVPPKT